MIVRRIREHAAELHWFAVGVDLIVAIVGVFAGIQVSNWNEARGQRAQSHEDRQRLIADLDVSLIDYANRQQYFRAVQSHAEAALAALGKPVVGADGERFLIDSYQASQISTRESKRVTYDEILATGRLTRLGNPALRDRVGNYYITQQSAGVVIDFVPPYRDRLRRAMPGATQLAIRAQCPERHEFLGTAALYTLAERCTLKLDPATIAAGVRAVRGIPELADELNRVIGDASVKLEAVDVQVLNTRVLRAQVATADAQS